jgi:hypothetical protein
MTTTAASFLGSNPHVAPSPHGVDAYGLYIETVEVNSLNQVQWYNRIFLAGNAISFYHRAAHASRTTWKLYRYADTATAEKALTKFTTGGRGTMLLRGAPILVQLDAVDVTAIDEMKMPIARYRGNNRHESLFGKFNLDDTPQIAPQALNAKGFDSANAAIVAAAASAAAAAKVATDLTSTMTPPLPTVGGMTSGTTTSGTTTATIITTSSGTEPY